AERAHAAEAPTRGAFGNERQRQQGGERDGCESRAARETESLARRSLVRRLLARRSLARDGVGHGQPPTARRAGAPGATAALFFCRYGRRSGLLLASATKICRPSRPANPGRLISRPTSGRRSEPLSLPAAA